MNSVLRGILVGLHALVSLTAVVGGAILVVGSLDPGFESTWNPPADYLAGSPFSSYFIPGLALLVFLGGLQGLACVMLLRRSGAAPLVSAGAGLVMFVWIFVQMMYIPFSILQAIYFAIALVEVALVVVDSRLLIAGARSSGPRRSGGAEIR